MTCKYQTSFRWTPDETSPPTAVPFPWPGCVIRSNSSSVGIFLSDERAVRVRLMTSFPSSQASSSVSSGFSSVVASSPDAPRRIKRRRSGISGICRINFWICTSVISSGITGRSHRWTRVAELKSRLLCVDQSHPCSSWSVIENLVFPPQENSNPWWNRNNHQLHLVLESGCIPIDVRLDKAAAACPWTSTFEDADKGRRTSHNPISSSACFKSSLIASTAKNAVISLSTAYDFLLRSSTLMHFWAACAESKALLFLSDEAANYY